MRQAWASRQPPAVVFRWPGGRAAVVVALAFACLCTIGAVAQPAGAPQQPAASVAVSGTFAATVPAPAASSAHLPLHSNSALTFGPVYLPREVVLSPAQIDAIKAAVAAQMVAYYDVRTEQNRANKLRLAVEHRDVEDHHRFNQWNRAHAQTVFDEQRFYSKAIFWATMALMLSALFLTVFQFVKDSRLAALAAGKLLGMEDAGPPKQGGMSTVSAAQAAGSPNATVSVTVAEAHNAPAEIEASTGEGIGPGGSAGSLDSALLAAMGQHVSKTTLKWGPTGVELGTQVVGLAVFGFALAFFYLYLAHVYPVTIANQPNAGALSVVSPAAPQPAASATR